MSLNNLSLIKLKKHNQEELYKSIEDKLNIINPQSYMPIFNTRVEIKNNNFSKGLFILNSKNIFLNVNEVYDSDYKITELLQGKINVNLINKNIYSQSNSYDSYKNYIVNKDIFIKSNPILDVLKYMEGKYKTNLEIPSIFSFKTNNKINNINNNAYIEVICCYYLNLLNEKKMTSLFPEFYGAFNGISKSYMHDISEDYEYIKNNDWYEKNINNLFEIIKNDNLSDFDELTFDNLEKLNYKNVNNNFEINNIDNLSFDDIELDELEQINYNESKEKQIRGEDNCEEQEEDCEEQEEDCEEQEEDCEDENCEEQEEDQDENYEEQEEDENCEEEDENCEEEDENYEDEDCKEQKEDEKDENCEEQKEDEDEEEDCKEQKEDEDEKCEEQKEYENCEEILIESISSSSISSSSSSSTSSSTSSSSISLNSYMSNGSCIISETFAKLKSIPIQILGVELMDNTLTDLIKNDLDKEEWRSILFQICFGLSVAQKHLNFIHNDLHTDNVMFKKIEEEYKYFLYQNIYYRIPTFKKETKIIDFARGIIKIGNKTYVSDVFKKDGDAGGQYDYVNSGCCFKKNKNYNMNFDLARLGTTIINYLDDKEITKFVHEWTIGKNGEDFTELNDDFSLYVEISKYANNALPKNQINKGFFKQYQIKKDEIPLNQHIYVY